MSFSLELLSFFHLEFFSKCPICKPALVIYFVCVIIIFEKIQSFAVCALPLSILNSLAVMERENTSATNVFVFACFLSPLQPARHTEAAFLLSEKHKALSEVRAKVCLCPATILVHLFISLRKIQADEGNQCLPEIYPKNVARKFLNRRVT